ncbi:MAG: TatD family hydrolase [Lachnospiraceae bacterium]|nr:TatD family hydrolase [Lachnospiraceae bacterium]
MIFDTHAHYDDEAFDEDRDSLIASLKDNGITRVVNVGADLKGSRASVELADKYDFIYAAIGAHPDNAKEIDDAGIATLKELSKNKKVVAIGEIGLDYYWNKDNAEEQKEAFSRQINLARELSLPIIIHSRDAAKDTMDILKEQDAGKVGGVMHCFSYSTEIAREVVDMGLYIGVGGVVTFKNGKKLREALLEVPLDKIILETDCPYLAPEPHRGSRNSSLNLPYVVKAIADIKGVSVEEVMKTTYNNACRMYRINNEE